MQALKHLLLVLLVGTANALVLRLLGMDTHGAGIALSTMSISG